MEANFFKGFQALFGIFFTIQCNIMLIRLKDMETLCKPVDWGFTLSGPNRLKIILIIVVFKINFVRYHVRIKDL